jgi:hypothetical protein
MAEAVEDEISAQGREQGQGQLEYLHLKALNNQTFYLTL